MYKYSFLLVAHILFWTIYASIEHISHLLYGQNHWQGSLFASLFVMFFTGLLALTYVRINNDKYVIKLMLIFVFLFLITIAWHNLSRILHNHIALDTLFQMPFLGWFNDSFYRVLLIITWAGLFVGLLNFLDKKAQQKELRLANNTAKEAQLQQLMSQLNPHFLFNVLNSIDVAILEKDSETAHQMVVKLSRFLRGTLEHKFDHKIQLKQELALLDDFVEIEQQRFHQQIAFNKDIQQEALFAFLPPLILQPLLENAIKFSWNLGIDCNIELKVNIDNKQLYIYLSNSFNDKISTNAKGTNTGLNNVLNRLRLLYGNEARLHTMEDSGQFKVSILLPLELAA